MARKSNFVSYFRMLGEIAGSRLQNWTRNQGLADRIVSFGVKETSRIESVIQFGVERYFFVLEPTVDGGFFFANEAVFNNVFDEWVTLGSGHTEAKLSNYSTEFPNIFPVVFGKMIIKRIVDQIVQKKVFHFHDTSDTAGVKRLGALHDNEYLRSDASNLAAYLYR